jgi:hypothetical protein
MATSNKEVSSAFNFTAVTPSDTIDLAQPARAFFVGTGGNIAVVPLDGTAAVTFANVGDGQFLPIQAKRVNSTNTTATNIVALY